MDLEFLHCRLTKCFPLVGKYRTFSTWYYSLTMGIPGSLIFTASSERNSGNFLNALAKMAHTDAKRTDDERTGGWCADSGDTDPWLQVGKMTESAMIYFYPLFIFPFFMSPSMIDRYIKV